MSLGHALLATAAFVAAAGVIALLFGLLGRRVGTHPYCRRCGFDLFGLPDDRKVCPECGADLSLRRATLVGTRQRRPIPLAAGAILLLIGGVPLGVAGWGAWRGIDWQQYKPVAWLLREAQGSNASARSAALKELITRQGASALSKDQTAAIVDAALNVQGDATRPWDVGWGDLIETAHAAGMTSDAQWSRYANQAASTGWLAARVSPKWRAGQIITLMVGGTPGRVGRQGFFAVVRPARTVIAGQEFKEPRKAAALTMPLASSPGGGGGTGLVGVRNGAAALPPGKHAGYVVAKVRLTHPSVMAAIRPPVLLPPAPLPFPARPIGAGPRSVEEMRAEISALRAAQEKRWATFRQQRQAAQAAENAIADGTDGGPTYADLEVKLPIEIEWIAPDQSAATPVTDEQFRARVEGSLSVQKIICTDAGLGFALRSDPSRSVPLCFKVILRDGAQEWPIGHANFPTPATESQWVSAGFVDGGSPPPTSAKLDVVLRPEIAPDPSGNLPEVQTYWAREVVLKDVPVEYPPGGR